MLRHAAANAIQRPRVVQHYTGINASLIGLGHDGWSVQHAVQRC